MGLTALRGGGLNDGDYGGYFTEGSLGDCLGPEGVEELAVQGGEAASADLGDDDAGGLEDSVAVFEDGVDVGYGRREVFAWGFEAVLADVAPVGAAGQEDAGVDAVLLHDMTRVDDVV